MKSDEMRKAMMALKKSKGWSYRQMDEMLDIDPSTLCRWMRDEPTVNLVQDQLDRVEVFLKQYGYPTTAYMRNLKIEPRWRELIVKAMQSGNLDAGAEITRFASQLSAIDKERGTVVAKLEKYAESLGIDADAKP